jgi:hypothetical protein
MVNFIALNKKMDDDFIARFSNGSNGRMIDSELFKYEDSNLPLAFRGITKKDLINQCWNENRTFYFMDTGYFANYITKTNPKGVKRWHRIVKNNLQHLGPIIQRPDDRWEKLQYEFPKLKWPGWKKNGKSILLVVPSEKPCKFYGINIDDWIKTTIDEIKKYTNRPIIVRNKSKNRLDRSVNFTIYDHLDQNIFALVTYNSIAATEAVAYGIPSFTLAPNAASYVSSTDLTKIDTPYYPEVDKVVDWCRHLAYGQFNNDELQDGTAWEILNDN